MNKHTTRLTYDLHELIYLKLNVYVLGQTRGLSSGGFRKMVYEPMT